jgi:predicted O-methyltransferase YrrM
MINELFSQNILWQMSSSERASILYLLSKTRKDSIAIEIGSYKGGFTQQLSKRFNLVYSLDINHDNIVNKDQYDNVIWVTGDSAKTLPKLLKKLKDKDIGFILIDGDHSSEAVLRDINNVLEYTPIKDTLILMHDSWYEGTRNAINNANWNNNQYVQLVEKDFVPGDLINHGFVGGLALSYLSTDKRRYDIEIRQSQDYMYTKGKQLLDKEILINNDDKYVLKWTNQ